MADAVHIAVKHLALSLMPGVHGPPQSPNSTQAYIFSVKALFNHVCVPV